MSEIGVAIGLHKSLVSPTSVEFVKRTFFKGKDVSAVPISEVDVACLSTAQRLELARKYKLTLAKYLSIGGFGFRVIGSLSRRLTLMGRRARSQIVQFYSPYGVARMPLPKWIALKTGLGSLYSLTPRKERDLTISFISEERQRLLGRLEILSERVKPLWSLVSVRRDREWYGIVPHLGERKTTFPYFVDPTDHPILGLSRKNHPIPEPLQYVFDLIKELVYREPFLDMIIQVRDLKLKIEDPAEAISRGLLRPGELIDLSTA